MLKESCLQAERIREALFEDYRPGRLVVFQREPDQVEKKIEAKGDLVAGRLGKPGSDAGDARPEAHAEGRVGPRGEVGAEPRAGPRRAALRKSRFGKSSRPTGCRRRAGTRCPATSIGDTRIPAPSARLGLQFTVRRIDRLFMQAGKPNRGFDRPLPQLKTRRPIPVSRQLEPDRLSRAKGRVRGLGCPQNGDSGGAGRSRKPRRTRRKPRRPRSGSGDGRVREERDPRRL